MRKQYRDILRQRIKSGEIPFVLESGLRLAGTWLSRRAERPLVGPSIGTLILTYRCNYFCSFCRLPERAVRRKAGGWREFDTGEVFRLLSGFKEIRTAGIGITGGEPFIRRDLFDIVAEIRRLGMVCHVNTNGHFLSTENVRRLIRAGVDSVNVSLDAPDAETHNRMRGNRRSYGQIMKGIREILSQRKGRRPRVGLTTVLTPENIEGAMKMARVAEETGVDSLGFIPVHEYEDGASASEMLERRRLSRKARETLDELDRTSSAVLENSRAYRALFPRCFEGKPSGLTCYAPYASVVVDCYGRVFPCVPFSEIDEPIAEIGPDGLSDCWKSEEYARARKRLADCQACYWNCHTELNLLLQRFPHEDG